jgi:hypothetical protein
VTNKKKFCDLRHQDSNGSSQELDSKRNDRCDGVVHLEGLDFIMRDSVDHAESQLSSNVTLLIALRITVIICDVVDCPESQLSSDVMLLIALSLNCHQM